MSPSWLTATVSEPCRNRRCARSRSTDLHRCNRRVVAVGRARSTRLGWRQPPLAAGRASPAGIRHRLQRVWRPEMSLGSGAMLPRTRTGDHLSPGACGPGCNAVVTQSGGGSCGIVPYAAALPLRCTWSIALAPFKKSASKARIRGFLRIVSQGDSYVRNEGAVGSNPITSTTNRPETPFPGGFAFC